MENFEYDIISALHQKGEERETILAKFSDILKEDFENKELLSYVVSSNLIALVAAIINEHDEDAWVHTPPRWVYGIVYYSYYIKTLQVPLEQTNHLVDAIVEKLRACTRYVDLWTNCLQAICNNVEQEEFIHSVSLYNTLEYILSSQLDDLMKQGVLAVLTALTNGNAAWQKKVLGDKELLQNIISLHDVFIQDYYFWGLLLNISQHEDARNLPREVVELARTGTYELCPDIYAILCNAENFHQLFTCDNYLKDKTFKIQHLLSFRHITEIIMTEEISFNLLDLLRPLANLSIGDNNKVLLRNAGLVPLLLDVLQIDETEQLSHIVKNQLLYSKLTASEILWNLSFNPEIREEIVKLNGTAICEAVLEKIQGPSLLRKNMDGLLYMCSHSNSAAKMNVMISYDWASKDIVKHVVDRLKHHHVWLSLSEIQGNTSYSVETTMESVDVVIMCISQNYKDSENCKFEAEYAKKRKLSIVPLLMQRDYEPDGWLGNIIGRNFGIPLYDNQQLETSFESLVKAIDGKDLLLQSNR